MKRLLLSLSFVSVLIGAVACGSGMNILQSRDYCGVAVSPGKDTVYCRVGDNMVRFPLNSLWDGLPDSLYPVITCESTGGFDRWEAATADDPFYSSILTEETYSYWMKEAEQLAEKHVKGFKSMLFTVPGRVVACIAERKGIEDMKPEPDCVISDVRIYNPQYSNWQSHAVRYRIIDTEYEPSFVAGYPSMYIYRSIIKDGKSLVAIDRIYLSGSDDMLCLIYECTGNDDYLYYSDGEYHPYRYGEKRLRYLGETESWYTFEPRKNISMAIEYFYRFCDPVSMGALMSVRDY